MTRKMTEETMSERGRRREREKNIERENRKYEIRKD
jgi:hypothetical protein